MIFLRDTSLSIHVFYHSLNMLSTLQHRRHDDVGCINIFIHLITLIINCKGGNNLDKIPIVACCSFEGQLGIN